MYVKSRVRHGRKLGDMRKTATRAVFLLLGAIALTLFVARPLCGSAHPQMHATPSASCCDLLAGTAAAKPLDLLSDTSSRPLVAPAPFAYLMATLALLGLAIRVRPGAAPPPRSFYARSARILR